MTELGKAIISFVMSFSPHGQLGSHWADFHEVWYLRMFSKISWGNSSLIKHWREQRVLRINTNANLW